MITLFNKSFILKILSKYATPLQHLLNVVYYILSYQLKLTAARLKTGTAQLFRLANLALILINLSWYGYSSGDTCHG